MIIFLQIFNVLIFNIPKKYTKPQFEAKPLLNI